MSQTGQLTRRNLLKATTALALVSPISAVAQANLPYRDARLPIAERVRDLLGRMTLDEKVAQLRSMWQSKNQILDDKGVFSLDKAKTALPNGIGQIGRPSDTSGTNRRGATRFREQAESLTLINAIQRFHVENTRLGIPVLFHEETAHGYRSRGATMFPVPPALGSTWDPELVEQVFTVVGREARHNGATVALSPVIDLARDPRYGRVEEFFGEDAYHVAQMGIASVRGQQGRTRPLTSDRVFVTLKHFVHGSPLGGINLAPAEMSERSLRETYYVPFEQVIKHADPAIIMPAYNEVQGIPAHGSAELLLRTGRERMGFRGAYFSDYGGINQLQGRQNMAKDADEAAVLGMNAGVDADLPEGLNYSRLAGLVRAGRISEARVDESVARVLTLKFEAGLFERPYVDEQRALRTLNTSADIQLARKVAQKSMILLKNDGVLPLDPARSAKLAVIGPNAEEAMVGGYSAPNRKGVGLLAGIRAAAKGMTVEHAEGVRILNGGLREEHLPSAPLEPVPPAENDARIAQAVELAKRSDIVVLAVGDAPEITREALGPEAPGDRNSLDLYGDQNKLVEALIAVGKPIIAVLINGRPVAVNRLEEKAAAIIEAWYPGQEGGNAVADVVFGAVNPGGKLAVTFPRTVGDLPMWYNPHPSSGRNNYVEGKATPLYPFGHGLSYTTFEMSAPRLSKASIGPMEAITVEVDVTNTGSRAGDEVVQLYIRDDFSSAPRPILELKGFQRVTLAPGEKRTVKLPLTPDHLGFWDIDMKWSVEPGVFTISAGASSVKLKSTKLTVV